MENHLSSPKSFACMLVTKYIRIQSNDSRHYRSEFWIAKDCAIAAVNEIRWALLELGIPTERHRYYDLVITELENFNCLEDVQDCFYSETLITKI